MRQVNRKYHCHYCQRKIILIQLYPDLNLEAFSTTLVCGDCVVNKGGISQKFIEEFPEDAEDISRWLQIN